MIFLSIIVYAYNREKLFEGALLLILFGGLE